MIPASSFTFDLCDNADENPGFCASNVKLLKKIIRGEPGTCNPSQASVEACKVNLGSACACSIPEKKECRKEHVVIIDIYLKNNTDEPLLLEKGGATIQVIDSNGDKAEKSSAGWVSSNVSPPKQIIPLDTAFMRGFAYNPTTNPVTFEIILRYTIGQPNKKLGTLVIPVCRSKPLNLSNDTGSKGEQKRCFGKLELCANATVEITPPSAIYSIVGEDISPDTSQIIVEIKGSQSGPVSCDPPCASYQQCLNGVCTGTTGTNGGGRVITRQVVILIVVGVVSLILVTGFLFFLISLRKGEGKG
jgi:hypothetical protein